MAEPAQEVHDTKTRWAGVPIIGGNSDFGWGGGALLSVVRPNSRNLKSNEWSAEMAAVAMVGADRFEPRYQDYYLRATFDDVFQTGVKLTLRPSFTQLSGVNYYGLGNASRRGGPGFPDPDGPERAFFDYARAEGTLRATFGHDFSHHIRLETGMMWSAVQMEVPEDSRLAYDAREGPSEVRSRLNGLNNHLFGAFTWSLEIDTRDEEVNPHRGIYQTTTFTFAPGGAGEFNPTWGRGFAALRVYQGFFGGGWVLAARAMVDALVGDPPVYELSRFDNFSNAFGGEKGVRGIEAQRYYGKVKAIANLESRIALFRFRLLGQQNTVIFNQFFDFGRLWTDFDGSRALDGAGLGLKYSVGGGLRVLFQDSFVVAFDVGWSPDAAPLGVYLTSGHAF